MSAAVKHIQVQSYDTLSVSPHRIVPWSDCYLRFKTRPNRIHRVSVTLVGRAEAMSQLELSRQAQIRYPDLDYAEDIAREEQAIREVAEGRPYLYPGLPNCPDVLTWRDEIDRAHAEYLLDFVLAQHFSFPRVTYRWRRPQVLVQPVTLTIPSEREVL